MRIGVYIIPDHPWQQARDEWRRAEEMGFDHAWTFDHLVWGSLPDNRWFSCIPTLTAAALVTQRIPLGAFVISPNFRHPVPLARELQTLLDIAGDRLLMGLGAGGTPDDVLLGQKPVTARERVDRFQEFVRLLDLTLTDDHVDFAGEHYSAVDMRLAGGSVRDRIPLLLAGNGPRSVRFAAHHGDGWITTGTPADSVDDWLAGISRSVRILDDALTDRPGGDRFPRYLSLTWAPADPFAGADVLDELIGRAAELGFTDVVVPWPRTSPPHVLAVDTFESVMADILPKWQDSARS
ncbi:LLM class flavin-dependent oxidoreductase [Gordonia amarae]|uniref:Luciferase-like domain-containing protein n=2 Tax=Gordonia amarae TaxID=36821 RepID=G7GL88_9ACTN|nr:LLM class flavin-dependent oxidoreductase [Gordonia amarae]MCS3878889.1 alkanesulfonate monooxygenase SsuD/methylene tetrahydromethanopterin reductase-like flavin-dependent oxidoreductase (luciferase family) [Gordonia amarae]QHN17448.1 LLM class flavin-dependent oxidoreductase [Gordonia amarae]QHN21974.1 LLM class flavin-dependent oxidoreductase [Gordonia amarae]QHN30854.1 LLM class flavin-dependent oxidoreductase [Gordonia amarae]QHN39600.1 LLM class flavin-dependent oxidoreductase [Gordon